MGRFGQTAAVLAVLASAAAGTASAEGAIGITEAWAPETPAGKDVPLSMTVANAGAADSLLRARCGVANFFEAHTVDHGEGFPAMRVVRSIPIAANGTTLLQADGFHVMLLQTTRALVAGDKFSCSLSFRDAGKQDVEVTVGKPE